MICSDLTILGPCQSHTLSTALARKRGQLAGEIEATQGRLRDLIASLEAIGCQTVRLTED